MKPPAGRLGFANQLRGVAALFVASSHLVGIYWALPAFVAATTFSPVQPGPAPALYPMLNFTWFQSGPFGVALFFLISGLVIPFSLAKHTRGSFLLARILRIYPTFFAALAIELLVLHLAAWFWHQPFGDTRAEIVTNALLINNFAGYGTVDFVNWTLAVEVAFYGLVICLATPVRQGRIAPLFAVATLFTLAIVLLRQHFTLAGLSATPVAATFGLEATYVIFMFIGVLFSVHHGGRLSTGRLLASVIVMTGLFLIAWRFSSMRPWFPAATVNYLYAVVLFGALYGLRNRWPEFRPLNAMAAISFPFYLIHAIIGFSVIKFLMVAWHFDYYPALLIAIGVIVVVATLLHRSIERATIAWGHRLAPHMPAGGTELLVQSAAVRGTHPTAPASITSL